MQQVRMVTATANGGMLLKPYVVKRIEDPDGNVLKEYFPEIIRRVDVHRQTLDLVRESLKGVVNKRGGTGFNARLKNIVVSGKTGTAQVVRMKVIEDLEPGEEIPYEFRDHAWFVAFAPFKKPEIAIAVIVEHGGHGGVTAAPIARKIISEYFIHYPLAKTTENASVIFPGKIKPN